MDGAILAGGEEPYCWLTVERDLLLADNYYWLMVGIAKLLADNIDILAVVG